MNWKALNDAQFCLPVKSGSYVMFNKHFGGYIEIEWDGFNWLWLNGKIIPKGIVRWWRALYEV